MFHVQKVVICGWVFWSMLAKPLHKLGCKRHFKAWSTTIVDQLYKLIIGPSISYHLVQFCCATYLDQIATSFCEILFSLEKEQRTWTRYSFTKWGNFGQIITLQHACLCMCIYIYKYTLILGYVGWRHRIATHLSAQGSWSFSLVISMLFNTLEFASRKSKKIV